MTITRRAVLLSAAAAAPGIGRQELFTSGTLGYKVFRIQGIVVTGRGTVLAYCEARATDRGDWGTIHILQRRSTDGGQTFDTARRIAEVPDGPHAKNPVALAQKLADPSDQTYNNPVMVADRINPRMVHMLFNLEYMRAFYQRSEDEGSTSSAPVEITQAAFDPFRPDYNWKVLATGPGHGTQLRGGWLLVSVWLSTGTGGHAHRPSIVSTVYSDNNGSTWKRGEVAIPNTDEWVNPSETALVELKGGRVMLNARTESKAARRLILNPAVGISQTSSRGGLVEREAPEILEDPSQDRVPKRQPR